MLDGVQHTADWQRIAGLRRKVARLWIEVGARERARISGISMALIAIKTVDRPAVREAHSGVNIGGARAYRHDAKSCRQGRAGNRRIAS